MNRRALLMGTVGGLIMRVKSPSLVVPGLVNLHHEAEQLGITRIKTIGQRTDEVASEKLRGGKPPVVEGSWADGSAGQNLADRMHELGQINNATDEGTPPVDQFGRENFFMRTQVAANTTSTTSTVTYSPVMTHGSIAYFGVFRCSIAFEASFTHSASSGVDLRISEDVAGVLATQTMVTQTTRERYAIQVTVDRVAPFQLIWSLEYKCNAAGTATARAPWVIVFFERIA